MRQPIEAIRARAREDALRRGVNPRDVDLLLCDLIGESVSYLYAHGDALMDTAPIEALLERRFAGEPLQYIRGRTEFFGHDFFVDSRVLIPRPETEILVETAIARIARGASVVDIGAGSGCIAVSLQLERPDLSVTAVDRSMEALSVARRNRDRLDADVDLVASDVLGGLRRSFDVVISNPPYIPEEDIASLALEVRDYEPRIALTPGPRGVETMERILESAPRSQIFFEIGFGQVEAVRELAASHDFRVDDVIDDLAGIPRVVVLSKP